MTFFNPLLTALSQAGAASLHFFQQALDACIDQYTKIQAKMCAFKQRFSSSDSTPKPSYPKSFGLFPEVSTTHKRYADKDTIRAMFTAVFAEELTLYSAGNNDHLFKAKESRRTPSDGIAHRSACATNVTAHPRGMRT